MQPVVYLSGPMSNVAYEDAENWRERVKKLLAPYQIRTRSPLRGKEFLQGKVIRHRPYDVLGADTFAVVQRDRWDVQNSDAVLINLSEAELVSVGTLVELGWADAARKPIVLVKGDNALAAEHAEHPLVRGCVGWITNTLDEAVDVLKDLFK